MLVKYVSGRCRAGVVAESKCGGVYGCEGVAVVRDFEEDINSD
jgi:hypothetical protein